MELWDNYQPINKRLLGEINFTINADLLLIVAAASLIVFIWLKYIMFIPQYLIRRHITKMMVNNEIQSVSDIDRWYDLLTHFYKKNGIEFNCNNVVEVYYLYYRDHRNSLLRPHKLKILFPAQGIMYGVTFVGVITFCVFIGHILKHLSS